MLRNTLVDRRYGRFISHPHTRSGHRVTRLNTSRHYCHSTIFLGLIRNNPGSLHAPHYLHITPANQYMKASPPAAIQYTVPGETVSAKEQSRRRRRTYIRGVLSSLSEFIAVRSSLVRECADEYRPCGRRRVGMCLSITTFVYYRM